jgi:hypothetical protein
MTCNKTLYNVWKENNVLILLYDDVNVYRHILKIMHRNKRGNIEDILLNYKDELNRTLENTDKKKLLLECIHRGFIKMTKELLNNIGDTIQQDIHFVEDLIYACLDRYDTHWQFFDIIYNAIPDDIYSCSMSLSNSNYIVNKNHSFYLSAITRRRRNVIIYILDNHRDAISEIEAFGLSKACIHGDLETVKLLCNYGVNLHYEDEWPIFMAQLGGNRNIVSLLLNNGVNPSYLSLKTATTTDNVSLIRLIRRMKANISNDEIQEAFSNALLSYHRNTLEYLYKHFTLKVTRNMVSMLCLEDKRRTLKWLYEKNMLDEFPIYDFIKNDKNALRYRKHFRRFLLSSFRI